MENLSSSAVKIFTLKCFFGFIWITGILGLVLIGPILSIVSRMAGISAAGIAFLILFVLWLFVTILLSYAWAKMSYDRWHYEFRPEGFYVEQGIFWKKQTTIPYEKIQNVDIRRGILAQIFGVSDVQIQTAGYSGYMGGRGWGPVIAAMSEGLLPSLDVDIAESVKNELIKRAKGKKGGV